MKREKFKFLSKDRIPSENSRFVSGKGNFVADIDRPNMLHVAILPCHEPSAIIKKINFSKALELKGVVDIVTGDELLNAIKPLLNGLDTPNVKRYPLAIKRVRYAGEWVCAVVANSRAVAEDALEKISLELIKQEFVLDAEEALSNKSPNVHPDHGSNILLEKKFIWGEVEKDFDKSDHILNYTVKWGRNSTVPIETFGVVAEWNNIESILDVWASIQMPKFSDHIATVLGLKGNDVRVHFDVDVGGSYGVKRGIKHTILASYISRKLNRPIKFIEDRLENMRAGDAHGPERKFNVSLAFDNNGKINSMKMRALDNAGAYAGRAPFQLGKPIGAIVGPYKISSVEYEAISVTTNKAVQEAVRGFGQAPTNYALETGVDKVASYLKVDKLDLRKLNFIKASEFPYTIPSGSEYDSGDYLTVLEKVFKETNYKDLINKRDKLRKKGIMAGIGIASCLEPSGGNSSFEPLLNEKNKTTTWMESCQINVDALGDIIVKIHTTSSGQGHETLVSTIVGEILEVSPEKIRVSRPNSLESLPGNSPVGSRMAIMLGGAAARAADKIKSKIMEIAKFKFGVSKDNLIYKNASVISNDGNVLTWQQIIDLCHRQINELPFGMDPGLASFDIMQVPTGGKLPKNNKVHMYPCYSFEFHLVLITFDPVICKPNILSYTVGHDCGTVINPSIVTGMTYGGVAHGIGAALFEEFVYDENGQLMTQSFLDYLMPSSNEIPEIKIVKHCTPSPHTYFGQKGSGESGYLGAPAAISSAINDALNPLKLEVSSLPIRMHFVSDLIASHENNGKFKK